ncbi:hypothetical protein [Hymenobacter convexus]|uniref:hypothetical protein n=1 Tax=Hymenobacter sp. CA1UV-4 TaxID=3063782 RepID=UPI00271448B7|nr:hypothetical protein [Hymenobacter sp. CA1UV-4]MDO7851266.1 hypothetical protein [Hymenobacter sp. CA1UV-4]
MKKLPYFLTLIVLISTIFGSAPARAQWSPQAKGAVIGGLGGAAAGALINKRNRAVGGVVGGVAGGAIGYGVGKHIDNKKKQRAAAAAQQRAVAAREAEYRRELALARNRQTTVVTKTSAVPVNSLTASAAPMPGAMAQPGVSNTYLANPHYGDASKPYSTEEVRRKSW